MKKVNDLLNKYFIYAIWAFLFVSVVVNFRSCGVNKENRKLREEVVNLQAEQDSLKSYLETEVYTKEQFDIRMEILGLEISKRMLYDNNTVVRTAKRPDDILMEYDKMIKELRDKLK